MENPLNFPQLYQPQIPHIMLTSFRSIRFSSYYTSQLFPTTAPRPIKRQRLMTPQTRGNVLVNAKVNSPQQQQQQQQLQQQILLPSSPISNGNNANGCSNGINGDQNPTMYTNGQQHLLGPFKVYSKFTLLYFVYFVCFVSFLFIPFIFTQNLY